MYCLRMLVPALFLLNASFAAAEDAPKVADILACSQNNAPQKTFRQEAVFVTKAVDGAQRSLETRILGERGDKGLQLNLRVTAPPATAGTTILIREKKGQDDMRIFLPATGRSQGVTGSMASSKLLGTDFSYLDLKQMFGAMLDGSSTYKSAGEVGGHSVNIVQLIPAAEEATPYSEVLVSFDKETCVPLMAEFRTEDGQLLRTLTADSESLMSEKDRHYAQRYTLVDAISETQTTIEFKEVEYDDKLPRRAFHPNSFKDVN